MTQFRTITAQDWRAAIARARNTPNQLSDQIKKQINAMYFIIKPKVPEVLNANCYLDYSKARSDAAKIGAIVTNDSWLTQHGVSIKAKYGQKQNLESVTLNGASMNLVRRTA